jgi:hypothetical protein
MRENEFFIVITCIFKKERQSPNEKGFAALLIF